MGTDFDWTCFFATENRFNMGMLKYELPTCGFGGPPMHRSRDTAHAQ